MYKILQNAKNVQYTNTNTPKKKTLKEWDNTQGNEFWFLINIEEEMMNKLSTTKYFFDK